MTKIFSRKKIFFLINIIILITSLIVFSDFVPDPVVQYNQTGTPYIVKGGTPSGSPDNLNVLGEGLTYDIREEETKTYYIYQRRPNANGGYGIDNPINAYDYDSIGATQTGNSAQADWWNSTIQNSLGDIAKATWGTRYRGTGSGTGTRNDDSWSFLYGTTPTPGDCTDSGIIWINLASGTGNPGDWQWANVTNTSIVSWTDINNTCWRMNYTKSGPKDDWILEMDAFHVDVNYSISDYEIEVWHNSSQIADGNINFINATINFSSTEEDVYSLQIYEWSSSQWISTDCDSGNVLADTPTQWWCNKTTNPMNYNSSDHTVRIRINSTTDGDQAILQEDYVQYYIGYLSYLEVNLINPDPSEPLNVGQNQTFDVNATVICRDGPCGDVFGTVMYNLSSPNPDTPVNTTQGEKPFYIREASPSAKKSCGTMYSGDFCQLNWTINATGDLNTDWKIGVLFNSSFTDIEENNTDNATLSIFGCTIDFELKWSSIKFGLLDPSTGPNEAPGNTNKIYNITVKSGSCNLDLYINGTELTNTTYNSLIGVDNITWSNTSNIYGESFNLSSTATVLKSNVPENTNVTTWYWINVPAVYAGYYNGTILICGVEYGESPP